MYPSRDAFDNAAAAHTLPSAFAIRGEPQDAIYATVRENSPEHGVVIVRLFRNDGTLLNVARVSAETIDTGSQPPVLIMHIAATLQNYHWPEEKQAAA